MIVDNSFSSGGGDSNTVGLLTLFCMNLVRLEPRGEASTSICALFSVLVRPGRSKKKQRENKKTSRVYICARVGAREHLGAQLLERSGPAWVLCALALSASTRTLVLQL